ncbi:hypothetical protein TIFTF001_026661 [Ficus carica]|uniref:MADS-box transcription factor n=1 Tax=Ficus carica TaxID=3494 RepID=A0AA88DLM6_FICCA|nr:hypothetical protein TIFTF001_026661 [Ficus carica]
MVKTLERYQKCSYGAIEVSKPSKEFETQYMLDQLADLQSKLDEISSRNNFRSESWEVGDQDHQQTMPYAPPHAHSQGLIFQPLDCNPNLQIGFNAVVSEQITSTSHAQQVNGFIPGWML